MLLLKLYPSNKISEFSSLSLSLSENRYLVISNVYSDLQKIHTMKIFVKYNL